MTAPPYASQPFPIAAFKADEDVVEVRMIRGEYEKGKPPVAYVMEIVKVRCPHCNSGQFIHMKRTAMMKCKTCGAMLPKEPK